MWGADIEARAELRTGLRDGIPIALGYFSVALAVGLFCAGGDIPTVGAAILSATNLSSSGQFAGLSVMLARGTMIELAATIALVNLRYVLMSFSLSQKLAPGLGTGQRLAIGFGITDEIYALAMRRHQVTTGYYLGLMALPILGWTGGTVVGSLVGQILPPSLVSAFGVLLYAMFVAIVVPPAKESRQVLAVVAASALLSTIFSVVPMIRGISPGWRIIAVTLIAAGLGATVFPRWDGNSASSTAPLTATPEPSAETGEQPWT